MTWNCGETLCVTELRDSAVLELLEVTFRTGLWAHDLGGAGGSKPRVSVLHFMLCYHHLELSNFWARGLAF